MNIRKRYLFYILIITSSVTYAIMSGIDATVNTLFIPNPLILGFSIFFIGIPTSLIIGSILSIPIHQKSLGQQILDPSFTHLRWIHKKELKYHLLAGIGNATYTLGYLSLFTLLDDPSVVLPFTQIVILYLILIEAYTEKNAPTLIETQTAVMVTIGALLGSISLTGTLNLQSILIVFLILNPAWALMTISQRKLKHITINKHHNDSINIRIWNVIISFLIITTCLFLYDIITQNTIILQAMQTAIIYAPWMALISAGMFLVYILYIRALGIGKASVTQAIRSSIIIFTIPVSLTLATLNIIPQFALDPTSLLIKSMGIILIILGIISYAITQVKAYLLINIKAKGTIQNVMQEFWHIRGVTHVTATTGPYDLVVKIKTRTLLKGYERILQKVDRIKDVKKYRWESVLKDWEKI